MAASTFGAYCANESRVQTFHFNVANQCLAHKKRLTAQGNQALDVTEHIDR